MRHPRSRTGGERFATPALLAAALLIGVAGSLVPAASAAPSATGHRPHHQHGQHHGHHHHGHGHHSHGHHGHHHGHHQHGQHAHAPVAPPAPPPVGYLPVGGFGGPQNEWLRDVSAAPKAPNSAALVANLANQVSSRYNGQAAFNYNGYNVSFFAVDATTPVTTVIWDNCQGKKKTPPALYDPSVGAHFLNVPIPASAVPANGTDGEMSVYRPSTDQLWELWKANRQADGWHACWGGRIDHFSTNRGYFGQGMGVSASGMELASGVIGIQEMQQGHIDHALHIGLPEVANFRTWCYPAQRSDGKLPPNTPNAIMEGQRFRLDPSIDVSTLGLTPIATAVARAAQKYGFIVTDGAGTLTISTENGAAFAQQTGTDPWAAMLGGVRPSLVMKDFPWNRLQALTAGYGATG